jgi:hypothetical protein
MRVYDVIFGLTIFFSPCLGVASEQMSVNMQQASFGETAGAILLQANQFNVDAITRAVIGYSYGIGGFHKDIALAKAWLKPLLALEAMDAYAISALSVDMNEGHLEDNLGRSLMHCTMVKKSDLAAELEHKQIFNVGKICRDIETQKAIIKNWESEYKQAEQIYKTIKRDVRNVSSIIRELVHRAATTDEQKIIESSSHIITPSIITFYISTWDNSGKYDKNFGDEQIFSFIISQHDILKNKKTTSYFSFLVLFVASSYIDNIVLQDSKDKYINIIQDAHNGVYTAMRTVGNYYIHGISGFPHDTQLAQTWFQSGALEGDATSMLLMAISYFEGGHLAPAWAFVKVIEDINDADTYVKAIACNLKKTIESMPDKDKIQQRGLEMAMNFLDRSEERMKWRLQHKNIIYRRPQ